ncbi:hypothetical protein LEP1GSC061_3403 [Leptospira wolffii serovar Khorat str. Khorat-H2]|nr:hypothetical protein LEP1GSC061_3403 [Leptospira wolffii serovar Khorat str. Khorat-H2]
MLILPSLPPFYSSEKNSIRRDFPSTTLVASRHGIGKI